MYCNITLKRGYINELYFFEYDNCPATRRIDFLGITPIRYDCLDVDSSGCSKTLVEELSLAVTRCKYG